MTREDVSSLWRLADVDGNGRVDLNEFVALLRQVQLEVGSVKMKDAERFYCTSHEEITYIIYK